MGKIPVRCSDCRDKHKRRYDAEYGKANRSAHNEANRRYRERHKAPPKTIRITCPSCGEVYEKVHLAGRHPKRCPDCSERNRLARARENTAVRRKTTTYFKEYRKRNSARLTAKSLAWAKANPEKHNARGNRYRSRKYSEVIEVFTREEIAERDKWICRECKKPIDPALKFPNPKAGELDHVISATHPDYPGHTRANSAIVHSICNKSKGGYRRPPEGTPTG
jgi:5-methylcytosine-specific restriction endonuclease McrA